MNRMWHEPAYLIALLAGVIAVQLFVVPLLLRLFGA